MTLAGAAGAEIGMLRDELRREIARANRAFAEQARLRDALAILGRAISDMLPDSRVHDMALEHADIALEHAEEIGAELARRADERQRRAYELGIKHGRLEGAREALHRYGDTNLDELSERVIRALEERDPKGGAT